MPTCHRHYTYLVLLLCPLTHLFGHNHGRYSHQKGENSSKPDNKGNYFMHTESCQHDHDHSQPHEQPDGSQRDLVCGMTVPLDSRYFELYEGRTYRFCSEKCLTKFRAAPVRYLSPPQDQEHAGHLHSAAPQPSNAADAEYTCPMHPQIRQRGPGSCPICGMALEPVIPELEEDENPELKDFSRRFWWTLPLTVIVTVLAMTAHQLQLLHGATQNWWS